MKSSERFRPIGVNAVRIGVRDGLGLDSTCAGLVTLALCRIELFFVNRRKTLDLTAYHIAADHFDFDISGFLVFRYSPVLILPRIHQ